MQNTKLLEELANKRQGSSEAIKAFIYQSQYAIYQMLKGFTIDKSKVFVLKGKLEELKQEKVSWDFSNFDLSTCLIY